VDGLRGRGPVAATHYQLVAGVCAWWDGGAVSQLAFGSDLTGQLAPDVALGGPYAVGMPLLAAGADGQAKINVQFATTRLDAADGMAVGLGVRWLQEVNGRYYAVGEPLSEVLQVL
jgi:hypothetical protein